MKNIPIPTRFEYQKMMALKVESFIRRLRWKMIFIKPSKEDLNTTFVGPETTYGFRSEAKPRFVPELADFEEDLYDLLRKIEYTSAPSSQMQKDLRKTISDLKGMDSVIVSADKSRNLYVMEPSEYRKAVTENVTMDYRKSTVQAVKEVNNKSAEIANKLKLADRMEVHTKAECFLTLKDHKRSFPSKLECRLINPAKHSVGRVSKVILEQINTEVRDKSGLLQWRSTDQVLDWFNKVKNSRGLRFFKFDVVQFYPSIKPELLRRSIEFARKFTFISDDDINIVMNARKSFLYFNGDPWVKTSAPSFDVPMGAWDGAECCELVGLYLLDMMTKELFHKGRVGLYRDDGLSVVKGSKSEANNLGKKVIKLFKEVGLDITLEINLDSTDFLDVHMNLKDGTHRAFHKPNSTPIYIDVGSNHPEIIKKRLPGMIGKRLSKLCSTKESFDQEKVLYQEALKKSGHKEELQYIPAAAAATKRRRQRKVIYFNPPFNLETKTCVLKEFLKLIDKHFDRSHPWRRYINRHTVKASYCCTRNMAVHISSHNKKVLSKLDENRNEDAGCNCQSEKTKLKRVRDNLNIAENEPPPDWFIGGCPLEGKCLTSSLVYKATVKSVSGEMDYYGLTSNTFKERYNGHTTSFRNLRKPESEAKKTTLTSYIQKLEQKKEKYSIKWAIQKRAFSYKPGSSFCGLCLTEKTEILLADPKRTLNKRNELLEKCRHRAKFKLKG